VACDDQSSDRKVFDVAFAGIVVAQTGVETEGRPKEVKLMLRVWP
jgi:hypothetical protein